MVSFSRRVKDEILSFNTKLKSCCAFSFLYGYLLFAKRENDKIIVKKTNVENANFLENIFTQLFYKKSVELEYNSFKTLINVNVLRYFTIAEIEQKIFKCSHCREYFLRGLFTYCGTINDPNKSSRLELNFDNENEAKEVACFLNSLSLQPKIGKRNSKTFLYFKRSEEIEDFLAMMGAKNSAFVVMNSKINKELRNIANRVANCDNANINKTLLATEKYINAILQLKELGKIEQLSEPLREMAKMRLEYKELNFVQLGKMFNPPISKSGVYHRLEKILEFYNNLK